jgi:hypothetical protein
MKEVTQAVNCLKVTLLNNKIFNQTYSDIGSDYVHLLYHITVAKKCFFHVSALCNAIRTFQPEKSSPGYKIFKL